MTTDSAVSSQRYRVIAAGIFALMLTVGLARFGYTPLLPVMQQQAGLSDLAGGWLATFNYLGYISGVILASLVKDLLTKFFIYRLMLIVALLTTLAMGLTDNLLLWGLLRYLSGLSSIAGMLLASGLVLNWLIRHQLRPELGLHFTGMGFGIMVTGIASALVVGWLRWDEQWLLMGLIGMLFFVPAWLWMPRPIALTTQHQASAPPPPSKRWLWLMIAAYFCGGVGYVISATFIVAILEKLPVFAGSGAWVWVIVGLAAAPSAFLWDLVARKLGDIGALMVCYLLQSLSFVLTMMSAELVPNLISVALYGSTFIGIVSLTLTVIGRQFPHNPARAMARLTLSYGVAQVLAPALSGYIAEMTGSYHGALLIAAVVMLLGMLLLGLLLWGSRITTGQQL
ncbi:YbfB/YjiJ family MFS transporter [Oceanobacter mangrovi]|uniref:YbfB/YjiJ family MFS transporter n=1 Tax=Oceanobacter mangrovi TaxID=2862510 RepID=UPI001C8D6921|nr:YbfB/YjiJ family MFS transporter [Oceanobacter mangrovi]